MKQKKHVWVIGIFIFFSFLIFSYFSRRTVFNPSEAVGNTGGNLNNGGFFCERNDSVYFANAYDNYRLYSMNPDETKIKQLGSVSVANICAAGKYLYYYQTGAGSGTGLGYMMNISGLYRSNLNGKNVLCLQRNASEYLNLVGNYIYYLQQDSEITSHKIRLDKKYDITLSSFKINPSSADNGVIYFAGENTDHYLYTLLADTNQISLLWKHNLWSPVYQNGIIYFMDLETNYELHRYILSSGTEEVLTKNRLDYFNVSDQYIYYQKSSETDPALMRIHLDGSGEELVKEGIFEHINITSNYVYFNEYGNPTPVYKQSLDGDVHVTTFDAASSAALLKK